MKNVYRILRTLYATIDLHIYNKWLFETHDGKQFKWKRFMETRSSVYFWVRRVCFRRAIQLFMILIEPNGQN